MIRTLVTATALLGLTVAAASVKPAEETVKGHFEAIMEEDYTGADLYFSSSFRRAFKGDVASLNNYYLARRAQLSSGYQIVETTPLADQDQRTCVVVVEFADPHPEAPVTVTERIYYYLVREREHPPGPLADDQGDAWRIDIFGPTRFDTLAAARRRPYLYTREAWPEEEGRELKSRQGLYRIQLALEIFVDDHGQYPFRLLGSDNRRDELIGGGYIAERYPPCGFADRPMRAVEFSEKSGGDFSYYSVDTDNDGRREGYWLLLHGVVPEGFYFEGRDTIFILSSTRISSQSALAGGFASYWLSRAGETVLLTGAATTSEPSGPGGLPSPTVPSLLDSAEGSGSEELGPARIGQPIEGSEVERLAPVLPGLTAPSGEAVSLEQAEAADAPEAETEAPAGQSALDDQQARPHLPPTEDLHWVASATARIALGVAEAAAQLTEAGTAVPTAVSEVAPLPPVPQQPLTVHAYGF